MRPSEYRVTQAFVHAGIPRQPGDRITLMAEQAEYLRHGGFVEPVRVEPVQAGPDETALTRSPTPLPEPSGNAEPDGVTNPETKPTRRNKGTPE